MIRSRIKLWLPAALVIAALPVLMFVSCARSQSARPDGNLRRLPTLRQEVVEAPEVALEQIGAVALPGPAINLVLSPGVLYAAMAYNGLATFDLSNPTAPRMVERIIGMVQHDDPASRIIVNVHHEPENKRLIVFDRLQGLCVFDASDPLRPRPGWEKPFKGGINERAIAMTKIGKFYYVACGGGGLRLLPTDFNHDTEEIIVPGPFDHTRQVLPYPPHYIVLSDNYDIGLQVLDIDDPSSPRLAYINQADAFVDDILAVGDHHIVTGNRSLGFCVYDMTSPARPFLASMYLAKVSTQVKSLSLWQDRWLIVGSKRGNFDGMIEVFDLKDPRTPEPHVRLDLPTEVNSMALDGDLLYAAFWNTNQIGVFRLTEL